ncbi:hypothetical protein L208DRAFT_1392460, partial [Tricholoma matsutake]
TCRPSAGESDCHNLDNKQYTASAVLILSAIKPLKPLEDDGSHKRIDSIYQEQQEGNQHLETNIPPLQA